VASCCACGGKRKQEKGVYSVSLQTAAGSGYFWECTLSESGIVSVDTIEETTDDLQVGSPVMTEFRFTGLEVGMVTAEFCCSQSWDDTIVYRQVCELSVDKDNVVTGELSPETVIINPGTLDFALSIEDPTFVIWNLDETGTYYTFEPLHDGSSTLSFTYQGADENSVVTREFYMTVTEEGVISVTANDELQGLDTYDSVEVIEERVGYTIPIPEQAEIMEISSIGDLAYIYFIWRGIEFAYVCGTFSTDSFFSAESKTIDVNGIKIGVIDEDGTMAGWEKDGVSYYITSEETLDESYLKTMIAQFYETDSADQAEDENSGKVTVRKLE